MKIGQKINFIVINKQANSLHSLIADGQYRATSLGRNAWKSLIGSQASLQLNCNKEGFNAACVNYKVRIGIISNNESKGNVYPVTPESYLVVQDPSRVETVLDSPLMETGTSRPWVISWFNSKELGFS